MRIDPTDRLHDLIIASLKGDLAKARKRLASQYRRWKRQAAKTSGVDEEHEFGAAEPHFLEAIERMDVITALLTDLTDEQRHVIRELFLRGLDRAEVAVEMGVSERAVKSLRRKAVAKMRTRAVLRDSSI